MLSKVVTAKEVPVVPWHFFTWHFFTRRWGEAVYLAPVCFQSALMCLCGWNDLV